MLNPDLRINKNRFLGVDDTQTNSVWLNQTDNSAGLYSSNLAAKKYLDETTKIFKELNDIQLPSSVTTQTIYSSSNGVLEESLFDACAQIKILTSQVSMHLNGDWKDKFFRQLDLIHDVEDWDEQDLPMDQLSFKNFIRWFLFEKPNNSPGVGLSSSGNLVAAWMKDKNRLIIEFSSKGFVFWNVTIFMNGEVEQASGRSNVERLSDVLAPYNTPLFFG